MSILLKHYWYSFFKHINNPYYAAVLENLYLILMKDGFSVPFFQGLPRFPPLGLLYVLCVVKSPRDMWSSLWENEVILEVQCTGVCPSLNTCGTQTHENTLFSHLNIWCVNPFCLNWAFLAVDNCLQLHEMRMRLVIDSVLRDLFYWRSLPVHLNI